MEETRNEGWKGKRGYPEEIELLLHIDMNGYSIPCVTVLLFQLHTANSTLNFANRTH
jgi:hypothetical protein